MVFFCNLKLDIALKLDILLYSRSTPLTLASGLWSKIIPYVNTGISSVSEIPYSGVCW